MCARCRLDLIEEQVSRARKRNKGREREMETGCGRTLGDGDATNRHILPYPIAFSLLLLVPLSQLFLLFLSSSDTFSLFLRVNITKKIHTFFCLSLVHSLYGRACVSE